MIKSNSESSALPKSMSRISVALCTYNGTKFLREQLESIISQTQSIDELIVCDDGSMDGTIELIRELTQNTIFKTTIEVNKKNLGSTKNFEKAISLCSHDIIIFSDQDDRWRLDKVEKMMRFFLENPSQDAVFSNADIIDQMSNSMNLSLWDSIGFDKAQQDKWQRGEAYQILYQGFVVTGATLAVRKSAVLKLMPFPSIHKNLIHDGWIALALSLQNKIGFINENLISYRIHAQQQVGIGQKQKFITFKDRFLRPREEKILPIIEKRDYFEALYGLLSNLSFVSKSHLDYLENIKNHFYTRSNLPTDRLQRFVPVIREYRLGRYKYSSSFWWRPLLGDLFE